MPEDKTKKELELKLKNTIKAIPYHLSDEILTPEVWKDNQIIIDENVEIILSSITNTILASNNIFNLIRAPFCFKDEELQTEMWVNTVREITKLLSTIISTTEDLEIIKTNEKKLTEEDK